MSKAVLFAIPIAVIVGALVVAVLALGSGRRSSRGAGRASPEQSETSTAEEATPAMEEAPVEPPIHRGPPSRSPGASAVPPPQALPVAEPPSMQGESGSAERAPAAGQGTSAEDAMRPAYDAYANRRYDEARTNARRVIESDPTNARAWRMVGTSSCHLKDAATAIEALAHLDDRERRFVRFTCKHQRVEMPADAPPPAN